MIKALLLTLAIFSLLLAMLVLSLAKVSIHEIQAGILFLIFAVFLSGFAIVHTLENIKRDIRVK